MTYALEARGLVKTYGHVEALRGLDVAVEPGEVLGLIGDNGAGKSTFIRIVSGVEAPDDGQLLIGGEEVEISSPPVARKLGIQTVYQDLALASDLDAPSNLFLGREIRRQGLLGRLGFLNFRQMRTETVETFQRLGVAIQDPGASIAGYSGGQQQGVAVARAVHWASRLLLLDEPTAALGVTQTRGVLDLIRRVRDAGVTVVLISHNMVDVLSVCDRIVVLRLGQKVAVHRAADVDVDTLVADLTGASTIAPREK